MLELSDDLLQLLLQLLILLLELVGHHLRRCGLKLDLWDLALEAGNIVGFDDTLAHRLDRLGPLDQVVE